ncbi:hypothetical protein [Goodfellowiella coeruleoviolacea]|uniref:hypothetical protein n=1 Tax=Goodfellowiella coeruleoviolacea TaxID=334858 RepID=UPI0020A50DE7|nr:hypothetical protein [Goodfellowiella coeruleoviolacea]
MLDQLARIRRRQELLPACIRRIAPNGKPISAPEADSIDAEPDRPLAIAALAEIGEVTVWLPAAGQDRPELAMTPGGIGG